MGDADDGSPSTLAVLLGQSASVPLPAFEPPEQVGYASELTEPSPVPSASDEGGLLEPVPVAVVESSVDAAEEVLDVVDAQGELVAGVERIGSSPLSVELVAGDAAVSLPVGVAPELKLDVLDSRSVAAAGLAEVGFLVTLDGLTNLELPAGIGDVTTLFGGAVARFRVDYGAFVDEYGANWGERLRVGRFDECALVGGERCGPDVAGEFVNDSESDVITFDVALADLASGSPATPTAPSGFRSAPSPSQTSGGGASGFGLMSGPSSFAGNFSTTSLNPTGVWSVGTQSGSFTWSYPVSLPAPPAGQAPGVSVSYSAAALDGLTSDQNTQGGVLGPGWSVAEGFIERGYRPCGADGGAGADFCWTWDNATFSFAGMSGELVRIANETPQSGWEARVYRLESHSGWTIRKYRRTNLGTARGSIGVDNDLEYWVALAPDGTQYWFGYGREAGSFNPGSVLGSVQTAPTVGNHSGEPCNTLSNNWCHQAYRWSLDRIEDANGRVITFDYVQEVNHYGIRGTPGWSEPYVSAVKLERIEYGQLAANAEMANLHTNEVAFTYTWRCNDPVAGVCSGPPTASNGSRYPDIPVDQLCDTSYCTNYAPTFFHQGMLTRITTRARNASGAITNMAQDMFAYRWVEADGPNSDRLWLDSIQHSGLVGGTTAMPAIRFDESAAMANRVDYGGTVTQMFYFRVGAILDEYGSEIRVAYTRTKVCSPGSPAAGTFQNNTWSCFPRWWTPPSGPAGFAIWHRWVVGQVTVTDQSGDVQATTKVVSYAYPDATSTSGGMAWHSDRNQLASVATRSWGEFRGFRYVDVTVGHGGEANRQLTRHTFHRGMDNDINSHSNPDGVARDNVDTPSTLEAIPDAEQLAGLEREVQVMNLARDAVYSATVSDHVSWSVAALDTSHGEGPTWQVEVSRLRTRSNHGGVIKYGRVEYVYDGAGAGRRLIQTKDAGRVTSTYTESLGDDGNTDHFCATTSYTPTSARFVSGLPHRQAVFTSSDCVSGLLSDVRTYYDQTGVTAVASPVAATAPSAGNVTAMWRATGSGVEDDSFTAVPAVVDRSTYEPNGYAGASSSWARPATVTDARGWATSYAYTAHGAASLGTKTVTAMNAYGYDTETHFDVYGRVVRSVDLNDRSSYVCYDPLGRATKVYEPGVAGGSTCTGSASVTYAYLPITVPVNTATFYANTTRWSIQTRTLFALDTDAYNPLGAGDLYTESWANFDGFGRLAQSNTPSPAGGRIVTRTRYDSQDNPVYVAHPFHSTVLTAGSQWSQYTSAGIATDIRTTFDPIGRPTRVETLDNGVEIREQVTTYAADRVVEYVATATGSPGYGYTARHLDARGNVWKVIEQANSGSDTATLYRYDLLSRLTAVTDATGNATSMAYNCSAGGPS